MSATLLLEIGVEELPPTALRALMDAFADGIASGLTDAGLPIGKISRYATPRRLAVAIADTADETPTQQVEKAGPTVAIAFDADGNPTPAGEGFARSVGVSMDALTQVDSKKGTRLVYRGEQPGASLQAILPAIMDKTLRQLPIPKRMRWGDSDAEFVRPVHWLVAMHGARTLPLEAFDISADNATHGHRFHHPNAITLTTADDYTDQLLSPGYVIADIDARKTRIHTQVIACADALDGTALIDTDLLEEVTALVEWPQALSGRFEERYLQLPREVLISTLQEHQRYFPVTRGDKLLNAFITVANIDSKDPAQVAAGNERVIRPRLADALFFWEQDRNTGLPAFADGLDRVSFQHNLGSLADKTARVQAIAAWLGRSIGVQDTTNLQQAAALAKADLLTDMVDEFPDLQGTMGYYYALDAGMDRSIAQAIGEHYAPIGAGSDIATSTSGQLLAIADRLDTLAGIFSLGKRPSGDKDPFALRRGALAVLRTLIEAGLSVDLYAAIHKALAVQPETVADSVCTDLFEFHMERLRGYYADRGYTPEQFEAVAATGVHDMLDFNRRMRAISGFITLPAASVVCGAHKRARNLLKKNSEGAAITLDTALLADSHEQALADALSHQAQVFAQAMDNQAYPDALTSLADLAEPLDAFFEHVMVMTDDDQLRHNRLALLATLDERCRQVADISRLSVDT